MLNVEPKIHYTKKIIINCKRISLNGKLLLFHKRTDKKFSHFLHVKKKLVKLYVIFSWISTELLVSMLVSISTESNAYI